jgi:hypothetical protein
MSIIDYVKHQTELGTEYDYETIDGVRCIKLYRCDRRIKYEMDPRTTVIPYRNRMERFLVHKEPLIGFAEFVNKGEKMEKNWGHEPGIGINLTSSLNLAKDYYGFNYDEGNGNVNISTFYIKLDPNIIVLVIPKVCDWAQISCNESVHLTYQFIGHLNKNSEINLLVDNGFNHTIKIENQLYNLYTKELVGRSKEYRKKYLKYKAKYLALKKNYKA